jgi:Tfp pilus assembly PilM family ATPase
LEVIDHQSCALGNVFEFNYGHKTNRKSSGGLPPVNIILDIGAGSTKVSIVEGDKMTFARELRQSGNGCTEMLSERLRISWEQAEQVKLDEGESSTIRPIIEEYVIGMVEEIVRTLDFGLPGAQERTIHGVYICGGGSRLSGLIPQLEEKMPAPVQPLNPIQNIAGSGRKMNAHAIRELTYLGAVGIGLSLRYEGDA